MKTCAYAAALMFKKYECLFKFDLKSGYHHNDVYTGLQKYIAIRVSSGMQDTTYVFTVLPFRLFLSLFTYVFTKLVWPLVTYVGTYIGAGVVEM